MGPDSHLLRVTVTDKCNRCSDTARSDLSLRPNGNKRSDVSLRSNGSKLLTVEEDCNRSNGSKLRTVEEDTPVQCTAGV